MHFLRAFFVACIVMPTLAFYRIRWLLFGKRRIRAEGPFPLDVLEEATILGVEEFFQHRMENAQCRNKTGLFRWCVLHKDAHYIYSGFLVRAAGGDVEVEILYRTPRADMEQQFPDYERLRGEVVHRSIVEWFLHNHPKHRVEDWRAELKPGGIVQISVDTEQKKNKVALVFSPGSDAPMALESVEVCGEGEVP